MVLVRPVSGTREPRCYFRSWRPATIRWIFALTTAVMTSSLCVGVGTGVDVGDGDGDGDGDGGGGGGKDSDSDGDGDGDGKAS
jgi:hypothetical protein